MFSLRRPSVYLLLLVSVFFTFCGKKESPTPAEQQQARQKRSDSLRGTHTEKRAWFDVQHYALDITPKMSNKSIEGRVDIRYKVNYPSDLMQIDLRNSLIIDSVFTLTKTGAVPVRFTRMGDVIYVQLGRKPAFHSIETLRVHYHGKPQEAANAPWSGGFKWTKDSLGRDFVAVSCQHDGASIWFPCKDYLGDNPEQGMRMTLHVPKGFVGVSNGRLIARSEDSLRDTYTWEVRNPINTYNITMSVGKYANWQETFVGKKGKLALSFYPLDYNLIRAKEQFIQVPQVLRAFENYFGVYPFYEDGYKIVETPYLGMEHQSAIAYGNGYQNGYRGEDRSGSGFGKYWDFVIVHETAHEWFGNQMSVVNVRDFWINESFATYAETLFTEYLFGKIAATYYNKGQRALVKGEHPILPTSIDGARATSNTDMYYKGSNMWHTLREMMGNDAQFFALLHAMLNKYKRQPITTAGLSMFVSSFLRRDLSSFFNQYLRTTKVPVLEYVRDVQHKKVFLHFAEVDASFTMPLRFFNKIIYPGTKQWTGIFLGENFNDLGIWTRYIADHYDVRVREIEHNQGRSMSVK